LRVQRNGGFDLVGLPDAEPDVTWLCEVAGDAKASRLVRVGQPVCREVLDDLQTLGAAAPRAKAEVLLDCRFAMPTLTHAASPPLVTGTLTPSGAPRASRLRTLR